ncbi:MAG: carbohydrate ABC transporter permease [Clostridiales bacterium]|jgi:ABC-type glycerol-3-phosphate transport system permease component|nr:carbohydrate ABC transporter permease [Clostridiales bacterium]
MANVNSEAARGAGASRGGRAGMKSAMRPAAGDRAFQAFVRAYLAAAMLIVLYPLVYVVSSSLSSSYAVISGRVALWPVDFSLDGYNAVFKHSLLMSGFWNAVFYAVFGTLVNLAMTIAAGFVLSRRELAGRGLLTFLFTFTMLFSGGMIPMYLTVRGAGLYNTRLAMMLPNAIGVWYLIICRTYFQNSIPRELAEAAELDGCSDISFFTRVALPLSAPIIAVLALFYAVGHWNAYFDALMYLKSQSLWPLQIILRNILIQSEISAEMLTDVRLMERSQGMKDLIKFSVIVVSSAPMLAIYPFVQKYFIRGIMVGALKG